MNKTIFLTGATGLVGGNLISRVLTENPANSLVLLVRANSREEAEGRVARTLSLVSPNLSWENARKRIQVVNGDVSLDKLGLNERDYAATAIATTHIIHSAAAVKFNNPLDLARKMNVVGTKNMITFAKKAQKLGDLHRFAYVSTAYVCGEREGTIVEDELLPVAAFANSYEQAKHEAEALVRLQMHELPITVFRPSIIVGDSQSGRTTAFNVLYFPLRLIHRGLLKFLPGSRNTPADVVPVDYVSDALCHIFLTTEEGIGETF
ncbi:MAG TPA: SDR family oxidoreductase, partial [Bacteroidota bacterium]|nr:SDR family oxidoreductase [Bacteroidota bacterium]